MAVKLGDALLYLGADDDKLKRDLTQAQEKTKGWGGVMTGVLQGIGQGIAGAVTGIISGAMQTIGESIGLASDLAETTDKVRVLFGESSAGIEEWASSAAANLGMTKQAALDSIGTIGNLFMQLGENSDATAGISENLVQLAADLGSFHNADPTEILDSMSAAFRGEYDALQKYVPMINAANVEQRALADTHKATAAELTALDKATAAYELTIEGAGAATGNFADTSDGWANTMKTLNSYWTEFKTLLGETLLPILTPLLAKLKDMATSALPAISNFIHDNVIPAIEAWGANFDSWWAEHGQPFIDDVTQAWQDVLDAARESMGDTSDEFGFNLESMEAVAGVLGARIGEALGDAITSGIGTRFSNWAASVWPSLVQGLIDNVPWLAMLQQYGLLSGPLHTAPSIPAPNMAPPVGPSAQSMNSAVTINNYVDATSRSVGEAARDGTLDGLRQAGMR